MDIEFITNNWYLFAALIVISLLIGIDTMRRGAGHSTQISAVQLPQFINHENAVVVDVCDSEEFRKGHIPSAINIPAGEVKDSLGRLQKYRAKDRPIVLSIAAGQHDGSVFFAKFFQLAQLFFDLFNRYVDGRRDVSFAKLFGWADIHHHRVFLIDELR